MYTKEGIKELIESNRLREAKLAVQQLEKVMPGDVEIISIKAVIYITENDLDTAEELLHVGLEQYPTSFDLLYNLAYIYQLHKKTQLAVGYYSRALENVSDEALGLHVKEMITTLKEGLDSNISVKLQANTSRPIVSIVLLAYNHLNYTKLCIESIYQYTSHINFELITVNNGSSDGTEEYFNSFPNTKIVHLQKNVGPVNGFNEGMKLVEGKYTACVCNDFIFTARWMDNLLACIESDEKIGFVSPGANYISNYQRIPGVYKDMDEMQQFAEKYNQSDSSKWEERIRLLPCVLMVRTKILYQIGYYDPIYYFGEFADDDIAFRIRRAGYKLIFTGDTFTYHAGSITTGVDQRENNSLNKSRQIFIDKFGIDSWADAMFSQSIVDNAEIIRKSGKIKILGIGARCGGTPIQIKNKLWTAGITSVSITNFTQDPKYLLDLKTASDHAVCGQISFLSDYFKGENYDYIVLEESMESLSLSGLNNLLNQLKRLLHPEGQLLFKVKNGSHYFYVANLMLGNVFCQDGEHASTFLNIEILKSLLSEHGFHISKQSAIADVPEKDELIIKNLTKLFPGQVEQVQNELSISEYIFGVSPSSEV